MQEIKILSFAKINLSIDVTGLTDDGMHQVDMVMHQLSFHDDVVLRYVPMREKAVGEFDIQVRTNRYYIPTDQKNLAYKAAQLMVEEYGGNVAGGRLEIEIFKRIPVAAGLAGGSGNGAAILHGLNVLWKLNLGLRQLCEKGAALGSDVPFCIMGQAAYNFNLPKKIRSSDMATCCGRAKGTGIQMEPLPGIKKPLVIAKPPIGVSTREVYAKIDRCVINRRPQNDLLVQGLRKKDFTLIFDHCVNVLEAYTLNAYPQVQKLKMQMQRLENPQVVLMSGSGPTVFAIYKSMDSAKEACRRLRGRGYEAYWTTTIK